MGRNGIIRAHSSNSLSKRLKTSARLASKIGTDAITAPQQAGWRR
jgi:hypothetical protein